MVFLKKAELLRTRV